jgi:hypothetical protein
LAVLTRKKWKKPKKQDLPQTIFLAIMIVSVSLIILPTWNYTRYYIALNNFDYTLSAMSMITSNVTVLASGLAKINITLFVTNPTDYSGLAIGTIGAELQYFGNYHWVHVAGGGFVGGTGGDVYTNLWDLTSATTLQPNGAVGPNSNKTILLEILIKPDFNSPNGPDQNAVSFIEYLATKQTKIEWSIICTLPLNTFLGTFSVRKTFDRTIPVNQSTT